MERPCDETQRASATNAGYDLYMIHLGATFSADDDVHRRYAGEKRRRVNTRRYHV
jgi:hypothetical protein